MESLKSEGFSFLAYNTGEAAFDPANPGTPTLSGYRLTSEDGKTWNYDGSPAVWNTVTEDKYTFLGYYPAYPPLSTPVINIIQPSKITARTDLLATVPVIDQTSRDDVHLNFRHIFSKLSLTVRLSEAMENQVYHVTAVRFKGIRDYPSYNLAKGDFDRNSSTPYDLATGTGDITSPYRSNGLKTLDDVLTVSPLLVCPYDYGAKGEEILVEMDMEYIYFPEYSQTGISMPMTKTLKISKDLIANRQYNINVTFVPEQEGGVEMAVAFDDFAADDEEFEVYQKVTELSIGGTANCYIVPKSGIYSFDATYKGNSTTEEVGEIASAEVLWESYGTLDAINAGDLISDVTVTGSEISFKAGGRKGNALIAAMDAEGNILWSWHIWLTDKPAEQVYLNGTGTALDRNLGAISASKNAGAMTYGLLYQWGRKDPFVGVGATSGTVMAATTSAWTKTASSETIGTDSYANAHPTEFITASFSSGKYSWLWKSDSKRWKGSDGSKTVNDPCPPGYRIPEGGTTNKFFKDTFASQTALPTFEGGYDFGTDGTGHMALTEDPSCWYPATGFISTGGTIQASGNSGDYWLNYDSGGYESIFTFDSANVKPQMSNCGAYGFTVRCVKE